MNWRIQTNTPVIVRITKKVALTGNLFDCEGYDSEGRLWSWFETYHWTTGLKEYAHSQLWVKENEE